MLVFHNPAQMRQGKGKAEAKLPLLILMSKVRSQTHDPTPYPGQVVEWQRGATFPLPRACSEGGRTRRPRVESALLFFLTTAKFQLGWNSLQARKLPLISLYCLNVGAHKYFTEPIIGRKCLQ